MVPRTIEVSAWGAVCVGVWLLTLSSVTVPDLCLAVPASLLCGVLALTGRRLVGGRWCPLRGWWTWLLTLPVAVIADTFGVWRAAARAVLRPGERGHEHVVHLPASDADDVAATRRALVTLALSASPGSYVVDFDPDRRELLVHTLADGAPGWARLNPRR